MAGGLLTTLTGLIGSATKLVGISPGGGQIEGASPHWIGTLTPSDFRPDVPCSTQAVPALTQTAAASDLRSVHTASPSLSRSAIAVISSPSSRIRSRRSGADRARRAIAAMSPTTRPAIACGVSIGTPSTRMDGP